MAKSFTDYVQTVIVKKGLTGLFQCPGRQTIFSYCIKRYEKLYKFRFTSKDVRFTS